MLQMNIQRQQKIFSLYITWNDMNLRHLIAMIPVFCWQALYNNVISCSIQNVFTKYPVKLISLKSDILTYLLKCTIILEEIQSLKGLCHGSPDHFV